MAALEKALLEAAALLRELPRQRHLVARARAQFARIRTDNPAAAPRLFADVRPGAETADYDILLTLPDSGTFSLSWHPDEGMPWTPHYADHWAANAVLTVNGRATTIQSALVYLNRILRNRPDMMKDLVDRAVTQLAVEAAPPAIDEEEIEEAVEGFRIANGLQAAAALRKWLEEMQLSMEALHELVGQSLRLRKFRQRLTADRVRPYYRAHRRDFDRVSVMRVESLPRVAARALADAWQRDGRCPFIANVHPALRQAAGVMEARFARDLPEQLALAPVGRVIGPVRANGHYWVAQVLWRRAARLDRLTRDQIEELLVAEWLAGEREKATIRWHWV